MGDGARSLENYSAPTCTFPDPRLSIGRRSVIDTNRSSRDELLFPRLPCAAALIQAEIYR